MSVDPRTAVSARYDERFAGYRRDEASVTFLGAEPMRVARFAYQPAAEAMLPGLSSDGSASSDIVWYCSIGCSAQPMDPAALHLSPAAPRAEVVMGVRRGVDALLRCLAIIAASPAVEGVVLSPGFLLDLETPLWPGAAFTGVVLENSDIAAVSGPWGADVNIFRAIPVTPTEAAWIRLKGAAALREAWDEAQVDTYDPDRPAVNPR